MMPKANCLVFLGLALLSRAAIAQGGYTVLGDWPTTTKADVYWSPDGNKLGSGKPVYDGCSPVTTLAPFHDGILVAFANVGCTPRHYQIQWAANPSRIGSGEVRYDGCSPVTAILP